MTNTPLDKHELVQIAHGRKNARAFCRRAGIDSVRNLEFLKKDCEECVARGDMMGIRKNRAMAAERMFFYDTTCWFDISSYWNLR